MDATLLLTSRFGLFIAVTICSMRGKDHRGLPMYVVVQAYMVYKAAARAMEEIRKAQGTPLILK